MSKQYFSCAVAFLLKQNITRVQIKCMTVCAPECVCFYQHLWVYPRLMILFLSNLLKLHAGLENWWKKVKEKFCSWSTKTLDFSLSPETPFTSSTTMSTSTTTPTSTISTTAAYVSTASNSPYGRCLTKKNVLENVSLFYIIIIAYSECS